MRANAVDQSGGKRWIAARCTEIAHFAELSFKAPC